MFYVYLLASHSRVLYAGVTNDVGRRLLEHRSFADPDAFVTQYKVTKLVYVEEYQSIVEAIAREKQIKRWSRRKKVWLIEDRNPHWDDMAPWPTSSRA